MHFRKREEIWLFAACGPEAAAGQSAGLFYLIFMFLFRSFCTGADGRKCAVKCGEAAG